MRGNKEAGFFDKYDKYRYTYTSYLELNEVDKGLFEEQYLKKYSQMPPNYEYPPSPYDTALSELDKKIEAYCDNQKLVVSNKGTPDFQLRFELAQAIETVMDYKELTDKELKGYVSDKLREFGYPESEEAFSNQIVSEQRHLIESQKAKDIKPPSVRKSSTPQIDM